MSFPYRYKRMRYNPRSVLILPSGDWKKVEYAAGHYNVSTQTIRHWYLSGKLRSVKHKNVIYVKIRKFFI